MNINELKELFDEVKTVRMQEKELPYLEKALLNAIIFQNDKIIKLLGEIRDRL